MDNKIATLAKVAVSEKLLTASIPRMAYDGTDDLPECAEWYAEYLGAVVPVVGKIPATPDGYLSATTDLTVIRGWKWPGIGNRPDEGTFDLDIDDMETAARVFARKPKLPPTPIVQSARGFRYRLRLPNGVTLDQRKYPALGLETRTHKGQVVLPPSPHPSGVFYKWVSGREPWRVQIAEAPTWLLTMLTEDAESERHTYGANTDARTAELRRIAQGVGDGERNEGAARMAGYYFSHLDPDIALVSLENWNVTNSPPMDLKELHTVARSIARRQARKEAARS